MTPQQARAKIKQVCEQKGWSVMELARRSQVSPEAIRRYVSGQGEISTRVVHRIMQTLGIDARR